MEAFKNGIPPRQWVLLSQDKEKERFSENLINLVQTAYQKSHFGSFVNTLEDVQKKEWLIWSEDGQTVSATLFFRFDRHNESWTGTKICGGGHDGKFENKRRISDYAKIQLAQEGWWIESNAEGPSIGRSSGVAPVIDENLLHCLFPVSGIKILNQAGRYQRTLENGIQIQEVVYGKPRLK